MDRLVTVVPNASKIPFGTLSSVSQNMLLHVLSERIQLQFNKNQILTNHERNHAVFSEAIILLCYVRFCTANCKHTAIFIIF